ncbi:hypothetical protein ACIG63_12565 [Streptomyces antimycoticus]|uniref:hypothetical protein n=1 Tax=Streptomyces antimycoticus TaxID=68175 RepID=UPI0037CDED13
MRLVNPAQPVSLLDRLTGRLVRPSDGRVLLGRYMIPEDETRLMLGTRPADPGDYLVGQERHWLLRADRLTRWSGDYGHQPLPDPLVRDNVLQISERVAEALAAGTPLEEWISIPPIVVDTDRRLQPHPLEERMRAEVRYVAAVCRTPHARLRTDHTLVPVSRARAITWRTVVHLSAHSETWAARRLKGVEPAHLLTPIRVPDYDLYENRVVAALVERLWRHVLARTAELEAIVQMVERGQYLLDEAATRPGWRGRERLYDMIGRLLHKQQFEESIQQLRDQLDALRSSLAPQLDSRLRKGVRTPYGGRPELRPTNLFLNDANYRHCGDLWNAWVRLRGESQTDTDSPAGMAAWCRGFARFTLLLVVQALEGIGLRPEQDAAVGDLCPGGPGLRFTHRAGTLKLTQDHADTLTLSLRERQVLRIVPLPHALTASGDVDIVAARLAELAVPEGLRLAVFYPGEPREREQLPVPFRIAVSDVHGGHVGNRTLPALVPVSPSDVDSCARVGRLLRTALDGPVMANYPVHVPCRVELVARAAELLDWVEPGKGALLVVRPPNEAEMNALPGAIGRLCQATSRAYQRGGNQAEINELVRTLRDAADSVKALLCCPVCGRTPLRGDRAFQRRGTTYRCSCDQCGTVWETRRCLKCSDRYAVLTTLDSEGQLGGCGDHLDRTFAQVLLAVPCWQRSRSYICPSCGSCAESQSGGREAECVRCHGCRSPGPP